MVGWMLGGQILGIADRFVIGAFRDTREVGIYSANYTLRLRSCGDDCCCRRESRLLS